MRLSVKNKQTELSPEHTRNHNVIEVTVAFFFLSLLELSTIQIETELFQRVQCGNVAH